MKMLALGTLLGGAVSVGLAATLLHVGSFPESPPSTRAALVMPAARGAGTAGPKATALSETTAPPTAADGVAAVSETTSVDFSQHSSAATSAAAAPVPAVARPRRIVRPPLDESEALSREASLIAEARAALGRGDSLIALRKARAARALPTRQLVPEELAVEAQALRALGRDSEASGLDEALRSQYPESALAR